MRDEQTHGRTPWRRALLVVAAVLPAIGARVHADAGPDGGTEAAPMPQDGGLSVTPRLVASGTGCPSGSLRYDVLPYVDGSFFEIRIRFLAFSAGLEAGSVSTKDCAISIAMDPDRYVWLYSWWALGTTTDDQLVRQLVHIDWSNEKDSYQLTFPGGQAGEIVDYRYMNLSRRCGNGGDFQLSTAIAPETGAPRRGGYQLDLLRLVFRNRPCSPR